MLQSSSPYCCICWRKTLSSILATAIQLGPKKFRLSLEFCVGTRMTFLFLWVTVFSIVLLYTSVKSSWFMVLVLCSNSQHCFLLLTSQRSEFHCDWSISRSYYSMARYYILGKSLINFISTEMQALFNTNFGSFWPIN